MLAADRLRWGVPIIGGEGWMGGLIYLDNLVAAVRSLPPNEQPEITLLKEHPRTMASPLLRADSAELLLYSSQLTRALSRLLVACGLPSVSSVTSMRRPRNQFDFVFPCRSPFQI